MSLVPLGGVIVLAGNQCKRTQRRNKAKELFHKAMRLKFAAKVLLFCETCKFFTWEITWDFVLTPISWTL